MRPLLRNFKLDTFTLLIVLAALFLTSCADSSGNQENITNSAMKTEEYRKDSCTVVYSYPTNPIEYGTTIELLLSLEYPEGYTPELAPITEASPEDDKLANTRITNFSQTSPIIHAAGLITLDITIALEAYLPGTILFPSASILFHAGNSASTAINDIEITTDSVEIEVLSSFAETAEEKKLNEIIIPASSSDSAAGFWTSWFFPALIGLLLITAAVLALYFYKRSKKIVPRKQAQEMTLEQLICAIKQKHLTEKTLTDPRKAFSLVEKALSKTAWENLYPETYKYYFELCMKARFSRETAADNDESERLAEILQEFLQKVSGEATEGDTE